jgi:molybdate transport system ATP-binding protein
VTDGGITARLRTRLGDFSLDVSLSLPGQGVSVLFGPSGCGKTTLLRCIAGLHPAEGELRVGAQTWQDATAFVPVHRRALAYVFQETSLFSHLSVRGNLNYGYKRIPEAERRVRFDDAVSWLGVGALLERSPSSLSGGQRQRVAIARALLTSPRLLLMDEPLASLDLGSKAEILPYLERLHDDLDIPVVYVTHSPDELARLADYVVVMDNGRALTSGPVAEALSRIDPPIRLGPDTGVVIDATVGEVDAAWHLARMDFDGGGLWVKDQGLPVGHRVRLRVLARDVSLAVTPGTTSIQNILEGVVDAIGDDEHPSQALVRLRVGAVMILARLTRRAVAALEVAPGRQLWIQVKSVAVIE